MQQILPIILYIIIYVGLLSTLIFISYQTIKDLKDK